MLEDVNQLAENKLILLYLINKANTPLSKNQLTQIVLENGLVNYFLLQEYLTDLISSNFIEYTNKFSKNLMTISEKGSKVLSLFQNRIPEETINKIDNYLQEKKEYIKREISLFADYTIENNNAFLVNLKALEDDTILIDIKVNVPSKKHAIDLCQNWKSNSSKIYNDIMTILL